MGPLIDGAKHRVCDRARRAHRRRLVSAVFVTIGATTACEGALEEGTARSTTPPKPTVEIQTPEWPNETRIHRPALERLTETSRRAVAASPVPALVPNDPSLLAVGLVTTGEHFVAFSATVGDVNLSVHATRVAHRRANVGPARGDRDMRGSRGFVSRNEGIWSASWLESGVAYSLEVECARTDTRCDDERYLLEQVERLVFVGPAVGEEP